MAHAHIHPLLLTTLKLMDTKTSIINKLLSSFLTLCFLVLVFDTPTSNATGRSMIDGIFLPSQKNEQPYRTGYHFQPPSNWMNDPNGPMLYQGVYHFFYQYNPLAPTFGTIVWGHAVSHDLVNWIHLDPAIYPTHEPDISSCWSGSATILPGNLPAMLYTGSDSTSRQVQDLAWPKNRSDPFLREWVKSTHNPIITPPEGVKDDCFRDPSTAWLGPDGLWRIVESKNRRVLWAWVPEKDSEEDDIEKGWAGLQSFPRALWIDRSGKQLIQWPVEEIETLRENEVKLKNKRLKSGSVVEIEGVTASQADVTISFKLEDLKEAEVVDTSSADPQALCTDKGASSKGVIGPFGVLAMASKDLKEQTAIFFRVFQNQKGRYSVLMCSDLSRSTIRSTIDKTSFGAFVDIDPRYDEISLRNLIDHSIIESFGAGGKTCITSRVYPQFLNYEDAHLFAFNNGTQSVKISQMSAWSMKNAEFTIDQTVTSAT
ncbi:putative glycosidase [Helianthus debilis subsp. tardiflorus]